MTTRTIFLSKPITNYKHLMQFYFRILSRPKLYSQDIFYTQNYFLILGTIFQKENNLVANHFTSSLNRVQTAKVAWREENQ